MRLVPALGVEVAVLIRARGDEVSRNERLGALQIAKGAEALLLCHNGSCLAVAEALLGGELLPGEGVCVHELLNPTILDAAKFRVAHSMGERDARAGASSAHAAEPQKPPT